ncbi:MAG: EamA family transporter [Candidatus Heimdallarchaeota archaeon]|nr:EamA family transporter [Candidatus Heimdallarchaeota archaeon]
MSPLTSIILAFTGSFLFGLTAVILKVGTQKQNLYVSLLVRAAASIPFLLVISIYTAGADFFAPFTEPSLFLLIVLSAIGLLLGDILLMHILKKKPVGMITPIIAINPIFTTVLLLTTGEESITFKTVIITIAIIIGVFLVTFNKLNGDQSGNSLIDVEALFYGLLIAIVWGIMMFFDILILREDDIDGITFSTVKIIIVTVFSIILLIIFGMTNSFEDINLSNRKSVKYMLLAGIVGWVLGIILVYSAFDLGSAEIIIPIIGLNPLFAVMISIFFKFEGINKVKGLGIILCVVSSIILVA